jgi:feruloyl-CoA synthase
MKTDLELFATPEIVAEARADGAVLVRSRQPLGSYPPSMAHVFLERAAAHPERILAAQRDGDDWRSITWDEAARTALSLAAALRERGLGPERPVMILSANGLEHLLLMLGGFVAGVPVLPTSTAYSLLSRDHERIRAIAELCSPGLVFADDGEAYAPALASLRELVPEQVVVRGAAPGAVAWSALYSDAGALPAERLLERLDGDTTAKILFTSGSTGRPKGVINTHRMLCSNQQALGQVWPFLHGEPPVLVDWLPWSHTFGGNHNLGQVLAFGGTLYIDDGRPAPTLFERTVGALRAAAPTVYYNVPAGYALLTPRLEQDRDFAEHFFSRLRFMFYAAAALPEALWQRLRAVADEVADHPVPLTASWGTTETAPAATTAHFDTARCGCIGVPIPGVSLKLAPVEDKHEIRVVGPNITPGYVADPEATAAAFDEEGYYRTGDAVRPVDPEDPSQGLWFDGRLAEDFKLTTGTWVRVGQLRTALVSEARVLTDAVICGHDRECIGALAWLNAAEAERVAGGSSSAPRFDDPRLVAHLRAVLERLNAGAGSATRIERLLLLAEPPDIDAGEITDKGYINQRAVLARRSGEVERLFAEPVAPGVIVAGP